MATLGGPFDLFIYKIQKRTVFTIRFWSGRQGSNLRPPGPKPGALPAALQPEGFPNVGRIPNFYATVKLDPECFDLGERLSFFLT